MTQTSAEGLNRPKTRVPPHSREAEESVLGAILLSPDAPSDVMDRLGSEDFYVPAHSAIFEAMRTLFDQGQPIDPVSVSEALRRNGELEKVGGGPYLARLTDYVPSTSNLDYYCTIVEENARRRDLIRAGSTVTDLAFTVDEEVFEVLDRAERAVLSVAERRASQNLLEIGPMFQNILEHIEHMEESGSEMTGLSTGFRDLDQKLAGMQPANLIVVAARPAMGKSALTTNIATNVALQGSPVAVFSLEMSKEEIVQRILASVGRVDSTKLRSGQLGPNGWQKVIKAASDLYKAPIFIDDSPVVTVTDIRAKSRRLKRRQGLGLVVVDYLQLMQASGRENRQQEIAEISRNLKNLARELEVPIIAVSQLNRSLESREDKRPRLSDLRESGCLTAATRLTRADTNAEVTLGELVESDARDVPVWTLDEKYRLVRGNLTRAFSSGVKPVFDLRLSSGRIVRASANHPFLTLEGWKPLEQLTSGSRIAVARNIENPEAPSELDDDRIVCLAHLIGDGCHLERHAMQYTTVDMENARIVAEASRSAFGVVPRIVSERSWLQVYLASPEKLARGRRNPMAEWLDELGLFGRRSWEKFIPSDIFQLSERQVALFLGHLWATDGCLWSNGSSTSIYYASSSRQLAVDVQSLLSRLDVMGRVREVPQAKGRTQFHVQIMGSANQLTFLDKVDVPGERGQIAIEIRKVLDGKRSNPNVDTIPADIWTYIREKAMPTAGVSTRELARRIGMQYCGSALYKSGMSRERAMRVAAALDDSYLSDLASSDVMWDEVVAIEPAGEVEVFDATVEGTHNFLANGIIVHNSIEQDADVVMFIYRHEYYHQEDAEARGLAEVAVAKHRAGSVGAVKMTFLPEFTRFADMGRDVS